MVRDGVIVRRGFYVMSVHVAKFMFIPTNNLKGCHMKSIVRIMYFALVTTNALGAPSMPNEYMAEWIGELGPGESVHQIFYVSGKNTRWQNGPGDEATVIMISNAQENVTYRIDVPNKIYEELPYQPKFLNDSRMQNALKNQKEKTASVELVGEEKINAQDCEIYRETSLVSYRYENTYWLSKAYGIPIKAISNIENLSTKQMVQTTQEWLIKVGAQSPELFVLPAKYKAAEFRKKSMIAFAFVANKSMYSEGLIARPENIHTALCDDQQLHEIRFIERHLTKPNCNTNACLVDQDFDRFSFIKTPLVEGTCLIGEDDFFREKTVLKLSENIFRWDNNQRPVCESDVINTLEKTKGLAIKGCWRLGRFDNGGSFNIVEYIESNGVRSASLSLHDGKRLVLEDWVVKVPTDFAPDVWRLGDEGVFHPNENVVLFGLRTDTEIELATVGYGGEGVNYFLKRTNGKTFIEILHEYVYTNGY